MGVKDDTGCAVLNVGEESGSGTLQAGAGALSVDSARRSLLLLGEEGKPPPVTGETFPNREAFVPSSLCSPGSWRGGPQRKRICNLF